MNCRGGTFPESQGLGFVREGKEVKYKTLLALRGGGISEW